MALVWMEELEAVVRSGIVLELRPLLVGSRSAGRQRVRCWFGVRSPAGLLEYRLAQVSKTQSSKGTLASCMVSNICV